MLILHDVSITVPNVSERYNLYYILSCMKQVILGKPLIQLPSVDSTNSFASALLKNGTGGEGTAILADYQTGGRGHAGNQWLSEENSNLLFSLILKPDFLPAEKQFYLSMSISNGIIDYIGKLVENVLIKWPNDILISHRKVGGILIENTIMGRHLHTTVVGIGLNVNQQEFSPDIPEATSLLLATGNPFNLNQLFTGLLQSLTLQVNNLYAEDYAAIRNAYPNKLKGLHEWALYSDSSGKFEGRIADVSDAGELMVMKRNGNLKPYGFKEIAFLPSSPR